MSLEFDENSLYNYSDDELSSLIDKSPVVAPNIYVLSPKLVAKHIVPEVLGDAVEAMEVAHALGIRVPFTRRIIKNDSSACCIMDLIEGVTLEEAWSKLSWFTTIRLAFQLRGFIRSLVSGECKSFWIDDRFRIPDRSAPSTITSFFGFWINFVSIRKAKKNASFPPLPSTAWIPSTAETLVLTHHDLAPRNILLDRRNQNWLVDWDFVGFYPEYFEYAAIWRVFSCISAGFFEKEKRVLGVIQTKFTRWRVGRRFEIMQNGALSKYQPSIN
ncbi:kinase-like domain-containing protein [Amylocarpus encephaloides]|uniref:Kinase-like domain-containing protein n=1 Tax=Amylocarpus encephaloides TaxID=45428 RepID=A0A9P7YDY0_9HELO|nr:kinase-like domain-containing protein [Amylocarpus encephaloides]